jgi:hypothetical protein
MTRHYRRRIRMIKNSQFITKFNLKSSLKDENLTFGLMERYYCDIIDSIDNQIEINKIVEDADKIIQMFSKKEEVFQMIDLIETNLFGILCNIADNTPLRIIECRVEYLKKLIVDLPPEYDDYGQIGCMVYDIIDLIKDEFDYTLVIQNIDLLHTKLEKDVKMINEFNELRDTLFSIINNIKDGTPLRIIECRIIYLKDLISKIEC